MDKEKQKIKPNNPSLLLASPPLLIHCPWNDLQLHQQEHTFFILLLWGNHS
jgi:hypothetical protein